jgi:hypothetical protein
MLKLGFLLLLLLLPTLQQQSCGPSNSNIVSRTGDGETTVGAATTTRPSDLASVRASMDESQLASPPSDSSFIAKSEGTSWMKPEDTGSFSGFSGSGFGTSQRLSIAPPKIWWWVPYSFTFYTECPQQGGGIAIYTSGFAYVFVNGVLINTNPVTYPICLIIRPEHLKCGCNKVTTWVYGYYPYLWQEIWLPTPTCADDCNRNKLTFYNRRECKCECLRLCCPEGYYRESALPCRCLRNFIWSNDYVATNTVSSGGNRAV